MDTTWRIGIAIGVPVMLGCLYGVVPLVLVRSYPNEPAGGLDLRRWAHLCAMLPAVSFASLGFSVAATVELLALQAGGVVIIGGLLASGLIALFHVKADEYSAAARSHGRQTGQADWNSALGWTVAAVVLGWLVVLARIVIATQ